MATPYQHAVVVTFVLGVAMASALWVPNVEFIFGLTGTCIMFCDTVHDTFPP